MPPKELGALVRAARKKAGYDTIYAFSQATGVSSGQLSQIEAGKKSPSIRTLERIMGTIGWEVLITFRPKPRRQRKKPPPH